MHRTLAVFSIAAGMLVVSCMSSRPSAKTAEPISTKSELDRVLRTAGTDLSNAKVVCTDPITTDARTWAPSNVAEIPGRHVFWWKSASGNWVWHKLAKPEGSGPEGSGLAGEKYVRPDFNAGALLWRRNGDPRRPYEERFDRSRGGTWSFCNTKEEKFDLSFIINDHGNSGDFADNDGAITHTICWEPLAGRECEPLPSN